MKTPDCLSIISSPITTESKVIVPVPIDPPLVLNAEKMSIWLEIMTCKLFVVWNLGGPKGFQFSSISGFFIKNFRGLGFQNFRLKKCQNVRISDFQTVKEFANLEFSKCQNYLL